MKDKSLTTAAGFPLPSGPGFGLIFVAILCVFMTGTLNLIAQVNSGDLIFTKEQNENWFIYLEQRGLKDQIELINTRILADTNVIVPVNTDKYIAVKLNGRSSGYCKPTIVVGDVVIYVENSTKPTYIRRLVELINDKTVKSIEIISANRARALYGSRGDCGVLLIDVRRKSTKRKLKKLDDQMHPPIVIGEMRWRH